MEQLPTKKRIIKEALNLFAQKGYEAVSVARIAEAVGIKAPSLYKHFKSKQDIFNAILLEMDNRYEKQAASMQINGTQPHMDMNMFLNIGEEQLVEMGKELFLYFLHDEYISKFRRMLTVEQYHNEELSNLYAKQYIDAPLSYQSMLLGLLIQSEVFIPENPQVMSLHFYAPMYLLLTLCECHPEKETVILEMVENHIHQFNRLYKKGD